MPQLTMEQVDALSALRSATHALDNALFTTAVGGVTVGRALDLKVKAAQAMVMAERLLLTVPE